jgi:hypothetical protein
MVMQRDASHAAGKLLQGGNEKVREAQVSLMSAQGQRLLLP